MYFLVPRDRDKFRLYVHTLLLCFVYVISLSNSSLVLYKIFKLIVITKKQRPKTIQKISQLIDLWEWDSFTHSSPFPHSLTLSVSMMIYCGIMSNYAQCSDSKRECTWQIDFFCIHFFSACRHWQSCKKMNESRAHWHEM